MKSHLSFPALIACLALSFQGYAADSDSIAVPAPQFHTKHFIVGTASGLAMDLGLVQIIKASSHEWRPDLSDQNTMPSRHSAVAWNLSTALARELIPHNSLWGPALQLGASLVSQQRVIARRHYMEDVYAGALVGVGTNLLGNVIANWAFGSPRAYPKGRDIIPYTGMNIAVSTYMGTAAKVTRLDWDASLPPYDDNGNPIIYNEIETGMIGWGTSIDFCVPLDNKNLFLDVETGLTSYLLRIYHGNTYHNVGVNATNLACGLSLQKTSGKKRPSTFEFGGVLGCRFWNAGISCNRLSYYFRLHIGNFWHVQPRLSVGFLFDMSAFSFEPFDSNFVLGDGLTLTTRYYLK